ncbi:hypothetical protein GH714_016134 [Hevea brasiliensis]|uniref:Cytochrome P450 n=1 Tax=Hevea brasiliensis TaxID=3981 RepID=A0A6A6NHN6_HEVBR|nr:hypothetical protein GH714_016134 [Hevea brasiliensis]
MKETQALFASFFVSDYFSFLGFIDKFTGLAHRLEKNFKEFDIFYEQIIQEHLDPSRSKTREEDILDILLQLWKNRSCKVELTIDHIKAVLMNAFVGGTETSAATVVWAMTLLMKNSIAMKKAQEEVRKLIGMKGFVEEEDTEQLPYLKAVIKETMRAPLLIPRESCENCILGGYDIPAKTVVYVNTWAIGRDPDIWENPEEFDPERFINSSIDLKGQDFELIPFGAGRRICPGMLWASQLWRCL